MEKKEILVRDMTPDLLADWLAFFDNEAFIDNPEWSGCYCQFYHADHSQKAWEDRTGDENRTASVELLVRRRLRGHLAYADGRAIGWCQACPRTWVPNLDSNPELRIDDAGRVGSILCFLVAPGYRKLGVAEKLLSAAGRGLAEMGLEIAEAYPRRSARRDASNYHGPRSMYMQAGYRTYREMRDFLVVRKDLAPATKDPGS